MSESNISVDRRGRLGIVGLDRPKALNALSLAMIDGIHAALTQFEGETAIDAVVVRSGGERGFCAGGDVKGLIDGADGEALGERIRRFFGREYALNYRMSCYPKPIVALMDGVTMGGGCGISLHCSHPIATDRTILAMPEGALGLFPDVGATRFLGKLKGEMGLYLALTGLRLRAADLLALGLATHSVPSERLDRVLAALGGAERLDRARIDAILHEAANDPGPSILSDRSARVDIIFSASSIEGICRALEAAPEEWARDALGAISRASPTTLKVTLRQLRDGRALPLDSALRIEFRLACRLAASHDFREGVRAILIDKDNQPHWSPGQLSDVNDAEIAALFHPFVVEKELDLPGHA
jgi:enoyl-CoA hydratase